MGIPIKVKRTALLKQENSLLKRENDLLKEKLVRAAAVAYEEVPEDCPGECDIPALKKRREFMEYRSNKELSLNTRLCDSKLERRFANERCSVLLCLLQDLQLWKLQLAEAELAGIISQIWECKTRDYEDSIVELTEKINCELDKCSNEADPFVLDAINDALRDM